MAAAPRYSPVRAVGPLSLTAISINTVIGSGIFALPAAMAQLLGPAAPFVYVSAGGAVILIALCFAEIGSRFESSGGPYVYARAAFGELAGFEVAWIFLLARVTALAAAGNIFSGYLGYFWPFVQHGAGRFLAITVMLAALTMANVVGVRPSTTVNNILTIGKLLPLCIFCVAGLFLLDLRAIPTPHLPAISPLQTASLLMMFALGGFENASIPTEEVIDPKKNVPTAILASVVLVVVLYFLIQIVSLAALPGLTTSTTPLASAARNFLGPEGAILLTIGALLSTAGTNHANLFAGPRMLYALGRDGCLPGQFSRLHPRYRTPALSIVLYALMGWMLAISSAFTQLAALSAVARLLMYTTTCLAVLVLRRRLGSAHGRFFLPGGAMIPLLALCVCVWLLTGSSANQVLVAAAALLAGTLLYGIRNRSRSGQPKTAP